MHTIYCDVRISRRKIFHHVLDDGEQLIFTSPSLAACLSWVLDQGETEVIVERENERLAITLIRVPS